MNLRQMEIVTDADKLNVDIQQTCMQYKTIKQWAYILHDKDDTRPHYHIYLNFQTSVDSKYVAEWFQIPENFISKVKGRKADVLLYLTHGNDSQKNKHQYSPSEVHANFDFETEIEAAKILGDFEHYSYAQQLHYIDGLPLSEKAQAYSKLKKLWELQCELLTLTTDRDLTVIFVCGKGGKGKTFYAKKLLDSMNYDYCISSSSNDPFQDYLGQRGMILDDLRDSSFPLEDLLKMLDNNTKSSVRSRFSNKVFNGDIIIITSPIPLVYWYKGAQYNRSAYDTLDQLYRRISTYVEVKEKEIIVYDGLDINGKPIGVGHVYKNELAERKQENKPKIDIVSVFDKICAPPEFPPVVVQEKIKFD